MNQKIKIGLWAASVSFAGSMPLGTLNLTVANYAFQANLVGAVAFALAAIAVEMIFIRLAMAAIGRLEKMSRYFRFFGIGTTALLLFLAVNSLIAAWRMESFRAGLSIPLLNPFLSGLVLSAANPASPAFLDGLDRGAPVEKDPRPPSPEPCDIHPRGRRGDGLGLRGLRPCRRPPHSLPRYPSIPSQRYHRYRSARYRI